MRKIPKIIHLLVFISAVVAISVYLIVKGTNDFQISRETLVRYRGTDAHVIVPEGVTEIGRLAFQDCDSIESIVIPDGVESIGEGAFANCSRLKTVDIPQSVKTIEPRAFAYDFLLEEVILPERLDVINSEMFYGCKALRKIEISPNIKSIGDYAFYQCKTLESVFIPDSVGQIGNSAFSGCKRLSQIELPTYNLNLGTNVFANCISLESAMLPKNLKNISNGLFWNCEALVSIVLPEQIVSIGDRAFYGCTSLSECVFPSEVAYIGAQAFYDCASLKTIELPPTKYLPPVSLGLFSVPQPSFECTIANESFAKCVSLDDVTIPAHVTVNPTAFSECTSLKRFRVNPRNEKYITVDNVLYSRAKDVLFLYPAGLTQDMFVIPKGVEKIAENAFSGAKNLKAIVANHQLKRIEMKAFMNCTGLLELSLNNKIEYIGPEAFSGCKRISSFTIPAGCEIAIDALRGCDSLENIIVDPRNRSYYSMDGVLFDYYQYALLLYPPKKREKHYKIPDTVKTISEYAFANNCHLSELVIPDSVRQIQRRAFAHCTSLRKISMSDSIEAMASEVFYGIENSVSLFVKASSKKCIPILYADNVGVKNQRIPI